MVSCKIGVVFDAVFTESDAIPGNGDKKTVLGGSYIVTNTVFEWDDDIPILGIVTKAMICKEHYAIFAAGCFDFIGKITSVFDLDFGILVLDDFALARFGFVEWMVCTRRIRTSC